MHEQSITFQMRAGPNKGKWVNTPGVYRGKKIDEDVAHTMHLKGQLPNLGGKYFDSVDEAEKAAVERSRSFDSHEPSPEEVQDLVGYPR